MDGPNSEIISEAVRNSIHEYRLSIRGATNHTGEDHWAPIEKALDNPWTPENPGGTIVMRLAENSLMHDEISERIKKGSVVERLHHLTYGQGPRGSTRLRKALAAFLTSNFAVREPIGYEQIIVMSGVTSVVDALSWSICNDGDGILIPKPFYTGYRIDVHQRSRGVLLPVSFLGVDGYQSFDDAFQPDIVVKGLDAELKRCEDRGQRVKAVLITNPHNPLGRCYPAESLQEIARFCGRHNLHLISNEIYANSVFKDSQAQKLTPFSSVLSLDLKDIIEPRLVQVVYGASKDFCANGLRLGMLHSRNDGLVQAVASLSPFSWTPYVIQDIWAGMLEDSDFATQFLETNHKRMADSYAEATSLLDGHGIKYYKGGNAGMFLWIDLRSYILGEHPTSDLKVDGPDASRFLQREAFVHDTCVKHGVSIACGSIFFTEELGWFRLTFTLPRGELREGVRRLIQGLDEVKRHAWED